jgi:ribonucleotide reductase beta subunit family protein with ferritin-like domain
MLNVQNFCEILENDRAQLKKIQKHYSYTDLDSLDTKIQEPLLTEEQRLCLAPIRHYDIWNLYKKQLDSFWTREEIDLSKDYDDFKKLDSNTKYFIKYILAFFATSDGSVFLNLMEHFSKEVKIMEAQICYQFQGMMEAIHSEVYSLMIEELIKDEDEKIELFNAINTIPCIKRKAEWAETWGKSDTKFAQRLVAFAAVEGIFFSGSFCAIYWLKQQNILPGLTQSNEFIARDEASHCDFACLLYSKIVNKLPESTVYQMIIDAVRIEKEFIIESLPCKLIGMNSDLMSQYIEFIADRLISNLGYSKIYNVTNPFSFMENINLKLKSNFFETRTTTYQKPDLTNSSLVISEDF